MLGMVIAGCMVTIFAKLMDQKVRKEVKADDGTVHVYRVDFKHPILLNFFLFLGETFLFIVLKLQLAKDPVA